MEVKSVYNFVPAPKENEVFKPDWADKVSHDIPFEDGESGEIEIEITAKTPIFVRNGHTKADAENKTERYLEFSNIVRNGKKEYFIPATSIKGMLRNVLEIMSFSRMKQVSDDIFSFRELNHRKFKTEVAQNKNLKTGWLEKVDGNFVIKECDFGRIEFRGLNQQDKTSVEKYHHFLNQHANYFQQPKSYLIIKDLEHGRGSVYEESTSGNYKAYLVCYGSINNKKYEYLFTEPNSDNYPVDAGLIKRFEDVDKKLDNTLWQYFKENNPYPNSRIPVFFKVNDNDNVEHFGFSRLYKMSNTHYLNELNPLKSYFESKEYHKLDLTEIILGIVEEENRKNTTLKGRVFISHAFAKNNVTVLDERRLVLGSPKASYFPFYLKDKKTYIDDATLSGFKKYPVHNSIKRSALNEDNTDIETTIKPLGENTVFTCKIRFHNLRKVEIGALLSAITFHGMNDLLDHNLGSAKPLGYGRVNIKISSEKLTKNPDDYLSDFEQEMQKHTNDKLKKDWLRHKALLELYAMSIDPLKEQLLKYPEIEIENVKKSEANEFANYIKNNLYLKFYSNLQKINDSKFVSIAKRRKLEKQREDNEKQKRIENDNLFNASIDAADSKFAQKNYTEALRFYKIALKIDTSIDKQYCKERINECENLIEQISKEYEDIIKEANSLFENKKWKEAKEKYLSALEIKEDTYPRQQKNKCDKELSKTNISLDGVIDLNDFNKGKKIIETYFKANDSNLIDSENDISLIYHFISACIQKSNKRWKKAGKQDWALVKKWVGQQTAQQWYNKLINK